MPTLREVLDVFHGWYPPESAADWDAVGLVCGDPDQEVSTVAFAVDATQAVAEEALAKGADLLIVHHPLFLKPVHGFAATSPKGRIAHALNRGNCALLTVHTNADVALDGVSAAIAVALGLTDIRPISPSPSAPRDKLTVFVPGDAAAVVRAALAEAGAGRLGDYDQASFSSSGTGRFRPLDGATPMIGEVGVPEVVEEERIEVILDRSLRSEVVAAMLAQHPYEEPAFDLVALDAPQHADVGLGRVGLLPETISLAEFAELVSDALPSTEGGVRVAGDPELRVRTVALCGGAGDSLLGEARRSGADVYLTSDLRHHPASEFMEAQPQVGLVDVAHWAAEWMWLPVVERRLAEAFDKQLTTHVSTLRTDPWTMRL